MFMLKYMGLVDEESINDSDATDDSEDGLYMNIDLYGCEPDCIPLGDLPKAGVSNERTILWEEERSARKGLEEELKARRLKIAETRGSSLNSKSLEALIKSEVSAKTIKMSKKEFKECKNLKDFVRVNQGVEGILNPCISAKAYSFLEKKLLRSFLSNLIEKSRLIALERMRTSRREYVEGKVLVITQVDVEIARKFINQGI